MRMQKGECTNMMKKETEAEIIRLFHAEGWRRNTIAKQLGLHHSAVERALVRNGIVEHRKLRTRKIDNFLPFIKQTLEKYPKLNGTRLFHMVKERGYKGQVDHFRDLIRPLRPRRDVEAYLKLATLPGEQAQCDWAHFGKLKVGNAERRLLAFVMVLSWSRRIFMRFYFGDSTANFLRGHVEAFEAFKGVPREILFDNLKSAVLERVGSAIHFNPELLALAAHYRFAPKPVGVRRPTSKGRVERTIQYIRSAFFSARTFSSIEDLNAQADKWCESEAKQRSCPENKSITVSQAFEQESALLLELPRTSFPALERKVVHVGKTPYARFDLNDYSVPHEFVCSNLIVEATSDIVVFSDGLKKVATHKRSFDKGLIVESKDHIDGILAKKRQGTKHRAIDRIKSVVPSCSEYMLRAAERGHNLGRLTQIMLRWLELYGASELEAAIATVIARGTYHSGAIQTFLDQRRKSQGLRQPVPLHFNRKELNEITVVPKGLADYDNLIARNK
jgi:transposase